YSSSAASRERAPPPPFGWSPSPSELGEDFRRLSTSASLIASSSASLVPEPMEKCAVCAASPSRMTLPLDQRSHLIRRKLSQAAEPRRCAALDMSLWPSRYLAKSFSQVAIASACSIRSKPNLRHTSSEHST